VKYNVYRGQIYFPRGDMVVEGKSGRRAVRLASQARKILDDKPQWDYTANYVQLTWRRNVNRAWPVRC